MKKAIHRIKSFIDYKGLSMRQFDLSIKASDGYTQNAIKKNGSVGSDVLERIIDTYTDLNPYWLITGKGEMISDTIYENVINEDSLNYGVDHFENLLIEYLDKPKVKNVIDLLIDKKIQQKFKAKNG